MRRIKFWPGRVGLRGLWNINECGYFMFRRATSDSHDICALPHTRRHGSIITRGAPVDFLFSIDWRAFFIPEHSVGEMIARGTVMYLVLFICLRFLGRRQSGAMGTADLLVIVLIADAAQSGMAHDYTSVTEGLALVLTILWWDFVIDWTSFHVPKLRPFLNAPAVCLIRNGALQHRAMRKEMITKDEIMSRLREEGVESPAEVKRAQLEEDGQISVIKKKRNG